MGENGTSNQSQSERAPNRRNDGGRSSNRSNQTQGRGRYNNNRRYNRNERNKTKFNGANESLNGNIFDFGSHGHREMYSKTMKAINNYIGQTFDNPGDIQTTIEQMEKYEIPMPLEPDNYGTEDENKTEALIFEKQINRYILREELLNNNITKVFSLVWGQCTDTLKAKLESTNNWKDIQKNKDALQLLKEIKNIIFKFEDESYPMHSLFKANESVYLIKQQEDESNVKYYERFCNAVEAAEQYGACFGVDEATLMTDEEYRELSQRQQQSKAEKDKAKKRVKEKYLAYIFINKLDANKYGNLKKELQNDYAKGKNNYPGTVLEAYKLLTNYRYEKRNGNSNYFRRGNQNALAFNQTGNNGNQNNRNNKREIKCYNCGEIGHIAPKCPKKKETQNTNVEGETASTGTNNNNDESKTSRENVEENDFGFLIMQTGKEKDSIEEIKIKGDVQLLNKMEANDLRELLLLDNQSTTDLFCDKKLLRDIKQVQGSCTIITNGGQITTNKKGYLKNYGYVWYHPEAITNILSLSNVIKKYKVTFNSVNGNCFEVHTGEKIIIFKQMKNGLYAHNTTDREIVLVNTVEENMNKYTQRQINNANKARELYGIIGYPSTKDFKNMVTNNLINNCPITIEDIKIAEDIYGPNIATLKGKTVRKNPVPVKEDYIEVPSSILNMHGNVTLSADIMFVNRMPFFVTLARNIKFTTIEILTNRKAETLLEAIDNVNNLYNNRGFKIKTMLMDPEFETLKNNLMKRGIKLNTTAAKEHVPEIERQIRVIKERARARRSRLPFDKLPKLLISDMLMDIVTWLNNFPPKGGISKTISPRMLLTGVKFDYNKHCKVEFGSYVQTHEEHEPRNSMKERTTGAIALRNSNNIQGTHRFMSLNTGKLLKRRNFTKLPMPNDAIKRVEEMANNEDTDLIFEDRHGNEFEEEFEENEMNDELNDNAAENEENESILNQDDDNQITGVDNENEIENDDVYENENEIEDNIEINEENEPENADNNNNDIEYETRYGRVTKQPVYYEPSMKGKKYEEILNLNVHEEKEYDDLDAHILCLLFNQMTLTKGIKQFGNKGYMAAFKEMDQLHQREVFKPINPNDLTKEEKQKTMGSLIFLKEKRDGSIKGRACADGRKQREFIPKEEATSPTPKLESILLTCVIDAMENRDVATMDIPNAFVQTKIDNQNEKITMKMRGKLAELLMKTEPTLYRKYVTTENGQPVLYVELLKALYGMLKSALLFYRQLVKDLKEIGFELNPYDPCVANRIIKGKQQTVVWHVDDLKSSHIDSEINDKFIKYMRDKYEDEEIGILKATRGKVHDYLGMNLDFSTKGEVKIGMIDYVKEMINDFGEDVTKIAKTPAAEHLFKVRDDVENVSEEKSQRFHNIVAKGLFLCKRARIDLQTTIAFLSTRVKEPDQDDWKKLTRMMRYLNGTKELKLTLKANSANIIKWWIDAAYAVHNNMRSHTGATMSMGKGSILSKSTKQKLNVRSSTEAELVGTDDIMPEIIWTNYFLEKQGYKSNDTIVYQDNKSAILLEKNGKTSSGKRTKHINVRYFFITDRINNKELHIEYCPTDKMIADYFTKPLQGTKFQEFRDIIMGAK